MADANYELHYAILGAGAMGYRYGVLLQELAGKKVDFVDCWQPNVDAAQAQGGVTVSRDHENRHVVPVNVYAPEQYQGDPDVWIVMVKQMQLADVLERCAKAGLFKDQQVVFSAMNGWGHFEKLQKYFKDENIYGGTAMVATVMNGPADVDFIGKPGAGAMRLVSMTGKKTLVEQQMFDDFKAANFNPSYGNDLKGTCMAKVIFNSVVNTLCTMYQIQMGQFIEYPGALDMAKQLIDEAYDACERAGVELVQDRRHELHDVEYVSRVANPLHYPSMYQDLTKGRETEVDYINGYIAKLGRQNDCPCRTHEFLTRGVHLAEMAFAIHHPELSSSEAA